MRIYLVGACALLGCHVYDSSKLDVPAAGGGGGSGPQMDGGKSGDGSVPAGDGGGQDANNCVKRGDETCNLIDDDCDGHVDEDTATMCAESIPNVSVAECVELRGEARCVWRECKDGFENCDGNPSNGCEPYCMCHFCEPGDEDAGSDLDGG